MLKQVVYAAATVLDANWIHLAQDWNQWRGSCERGHESSGSIKYGKFIV
jgi:hypothetical protein